MSIIDLILGQKIILITAGLAVMVLVAAITLLAVGRLKKAAAKRARKQALRQAARAEEEVAEAQAEALLAFQRPAPAQFAPTAAGNVAPAPAAPKSAPGQPPAQAAAPAAATPLIKKTGVMKTVTQETPKAMQDILSSVFGDEDTLARHKLLLSGMEPVDMADLLALCNNVAARLHVAPAGK
jgi:type II secretory pathway pseudopilin PulG